jgi:hypothetical protein
MELKDSVLPIVTLIGALLALFSDSDKKVSRYFLLAFLVVSTAVTLVVNARDASANLSDKRQADNRIDGLIKIASTINGTTENIASMLHSFGYSEAEAIKVRTSIRANESRSRELSIVRSQGRKKIRIVYYPKDVDVPTVVSALQETGFNVTTHPPINNESSNVVWAGNDVSLDDAKFVALTLMRAGVTLQGVFRLRDGNGERADLVEIGRHPNITERAALTVAEIDSMKDIPSDPP